MVLIKHIKQGPSKLELHSYLGAKDCTVFVSAQNGPHQTISSSNFDYALGEMFQNKGFISKFVWPSEKVGIYIFLIKNLLYSWRFQSNFAQPTNPELRSIYIIDTLNVFDKMYSQDCCCILFSVDDDNICPWPTLSHVCVLSPYWQQF